MRPIESTRKSAKRFMRVFPLALMSFLFCSAAPVFASTLTWITPPPATVEAGQEFTVEWQWTGASLPTVLAIRVDPTNPLGVTTPDAGSTSESIGLTVGGGSGTKTLNAPIKHSDGSDITADTVVKYIVYALDGSDVTTEEASVTISPSSVGGTGDPLAAKLTASDKVAGDQFGYSVAADGNMAVVGAYLADPEGVSDAGAAYIYTHDGSAWVQQAKLTADDKAAEDWFGYSVAIAGTTVVVGARSADLNGAGAAGAAYVFVFDGSSWVQQAKLTANDASAGALFGYSVSISGESVAIGARQEGSGGVSDAGAAYVFVRDGTSWSEQAKLTAADRQELDVFGESVSISGDTLIVGAPSVDGTGAQTLQNSGAVYVYLRDGTTWSHQATLVGSERAEFDNFGQSVSISGDTVAIGVPFADPDGLSSAGAVFVFVHDGTSWGEQAKVTAGDKAASDEFGSAVSLLGDLLVVGSPGVDSDGLDGSGATYVFGRDGASWSAQIKVTASDKAAGDHFGNSVSFSGGTLAVGAHTASPEAVNEAGAAYVYSGVGGGTGGATGPDLVVQTGTLTVNPTSVEPGGSITVDWTVENIGGGDATASQARVLVKDSGGTVVADHLEATGALAAGATLAQSTQVTIPSTAAAGEYTVEVRLDDDTSSPAGQDSGAKGNDVASVSLTVTGGQTSPAEFRIGLNFGADEVNGDHSASLGNADVAGAPNAQQANWNNLIGPSGFNDTIAGDDGGTSVPTDVTVGWTSNNTWSSTGRGEENNGFSGPDQTLMTGYLDTDDQTTTTISIANIPTEEFASGYDVYVYILGGVGSSGGGYRIVAPDGQVLRHYLLGNSTHFPSSHFRDDGVSRFDAGTFLVFRNLNVPAITVEATTEHGLGHGIHGDAPRAPVNAVQIVPTSHTGFDLAFPQAVPEGFRTFLFDPPGAQIVASTITAQVDSTPVSVLATRQANRIEIRFDALAETGSLLTGGSEHTLDLAFSDDASSSYTISTPFFVRFFSRFIEFARPGPFEDFKIIPSGLLPVEIVLEDDLRGAVDAESVALSFDSQTVSPTVTKNGTRTEVKYQHQTPLDDGSTHTIGLSFSANPSPILTGPGDPILASSANSPASEGAANAIDGDVSTKYLNFDTTIDGIPSGFVVSPSSGATVVTGMTLVSANDSPGRDPAIITLEGSNDETVSDFSSGNWELIVQLDSQHFSIDLSGDAERPIPVTTTGTGTGMASITGNELRFQIEYSGLSGAAIAAHIHGPAGEEESAGVLIDLGDFNGGSFGTSGILRGKVTLTEDQVGHILGGLTYVNIHTAANSGGEIRGQLLATSSGSAGTSGGTSGTTGTGGPPGIPSWTEEFPDNDRNRARTFTFNNSTEYRHYRWTVLRTQAPNNCCIQIAEVALRGGSVFGGATRREEWEFTVREALVPDPALEQAIRDGIGKPTGDLTSSDLLGMTSLTATESGIFSLEGLQVATNLEFLDVRNNHITDLSPLAGLPVLTTINIGGNPISDYSPLSQISNLSSITADDNHIHDLSVFAGVPSLEHLAVRGNEISDLSALATGAFANLRRLGIDSNPIGDFSALGNLTALTGLSANNLGIFDISFLANLVNLTELELANNSITDAGSIANLTGLRSLILSENPLQGSGFLDNLGNLELLEISHTGIDTLGAVAGMPNLSRLVAGGNFVTDLSPLSGLAQLEHLEIGDNPVSDVSALGNSALANLVFVDLRGTQLDLSAGSSAFSVIETLEGRDVEVLSSLPILDVKTVEGSVVESSTRPGEFEIRLSAPVSADFTVNFTIGGLAEEGTDFQTVGTSAVILTGAQSVRVLITPIDDAENEGLETVTLSLASGSGFDLGQSTATLRIVDDESPRGGLLRAVYRDIFGDRASDLKNNPAFPRSPNEVDIVPSFESENLGDHYGQRLVGYVVPPTSGDYVFYISADDGAELFLSTNDDPANKRLIALEPQWNGAREWTGAPRRNPNAPENISLPIPLTGGSRYYVEVLHKDGGGGDHVAVTWRKLGDPVPANGSDPIPGEHLEIFIPTPITGVRPTISNIRTQNIAEDTSSPTIVFNVGDDDSTAAADLVVTARSSRQHVIPDGNLVLGGDGLDRTLVVTPLADQFGEPAVSIAVTVTDADGLSATDNFLVNIQGINDAPKIERLADSVGVGTEIRLPVRIVDDQPHLSDLDIAITSDNQTLVPDGSFFLDGDGSERTLVINPVEGEFGSVVITMTVTDDGGLSTSRSITLTIEQDLPVVIADANLEAAIRETLFKPTGDLTRNDLLGLFQLWACCRGITDLSGLENAANLELIDISHNQVSSLGPLSSLPNLTKIFLGNNPVTDYSPLADVPNLRAINADDSGITDVSIFAGVEFLEELEVRHNQIADLSPLTSFSNLRRLDIGGGNPVTDYSILGSVQTLVSLSAWENGISDISFLAALPNLTDLNLSGNDISDLTPLAGLTGLEFLRVGNNPIQDLSPIANLARLRLLEIDQTSISDLSPIASLENLEEFEARGSALADLSFLADLRRLDRVVLEKNAISDIGPLLNSSLVNLSFVNLRGNPLDVSSGSLGLGAIDTLRGRGVEVLFSLPTLEITATRGTVLESGSESGRFRIALSEPVSSDLSVFFALGGSAASGVDYQPVGNSAVIPSGSGSVVVSITPIDDNTAEGLETVTLTLIAGSGFALGRDVATVGIVDDESPVGGLRREVYRDIIGANIPDLTKNAAFPNSPSSVDVVSRFESVDLGDFYGQRLSGYLIPPVTGDFVFYISGDDGTELYLSTDTDPANKRFIAADPGWNGSRVWTGGEGRDSSAPENVSAPIPLSAGQRYYVEVLHKQDRDQNGVGVAWQKLGDPVPANDSDPIPGQNLEIFLPAADAPGRPTISDIANQTTLEEVPTATILFEVSDLQTPPGDLVVTARSSRQDLVPNRNIHIGGTGSTKGLVITPEIDAFGNPAVTITVTVRDADGFEASDNFLLNINGINDPPRFEGLRDITTAAAGEIRIPFRVFDETPPDQLTLEPISSNQALLADADISFGGDFFDRELVLNPVAGETGETFITVSATDQEGLTETVTIRLSALADGPVTIADANLEAAIRESLQLAGSDPLTVADMSALRFLGACCRNISNLSGLETAVNLVELDIQFNPITDFSPMLGLTGLERLSVNGLPDFDIFNIGSFPNLRRIGLGNSQRDDADLSDLANFPQLREIELWENPIRDLSPLVSLPDLEHLSLDSNPNLTDYSPLQSMPKLRRLFVRGNPVFNLEIVRGLPNLDGLWLSNGGHSDLSPLAGHPSLRELNLSGNPVQDLTPLQGLPALSTLKLNDVRTANLSVLAQLPSIDLLFLENTGISDLSFLANLRSVRHIEISDNPIQSLAPLLDLPNLDHVNVRAARLDLSSGSPAQTAIQSLQNRGVTVEFVPQSTPPTLGAIADQTIVSGGTTPAINLAVSDPENVESLQRLRLSASSSNTQLIPDSGIVFGGEPWARNMKISAAAGRTGNATVTVTVTDPSGLTASRTIAVKVIFSRTLSFPDANLALAIRDAIQKPTGDLTTQDIASLEELFICCRNISSLEGIQTAFNLQLLDIGYNPITDFAPLRELKTLRKLWVNGNPAFDFSELVHLPNLEEVSLGDGQRTSVAGLAGFTQLKHIELWNNKIQDISPLSSLVQLRSLNLSGNPTLADISPLASLTQLEVVDLSQSPSIVDYSPLRSLPNLQVLQVRGNPAFDLNELEFLSALTDLSLDDSGRTDVSTLSDFPQLTGLSLSGNPISDLSPLQGLTGLRHLNLNYIPIFDPFFLSSFTQLDNLNIEGTGISDLSFVNDLPQLGWLAAAHNPLSSISAVVTADLQHLENLDVRGGLLDLTEGSQARLDIEALENRGIQVEFAPQNTAPRLEPIPNQTVLAGSQSVPIRLFAFDDESFERVRFEASSSDPALIPDSSFVFGGDRFNPTIRFEAMTGFALPATEVIVVTVVDPVGASDSQEFEVTVVEGGSFLVADANLETALREHLGIPDAELTQADLLGLRELWSCCRNITSLQGLEAAANLEVLDIGFNPLFGTEAFDPVRQLGNLRQLYVHGLPDFAISELGNFPNLHTIGLGASGRSGLSELATFTQLRTVELWQNDISDITPLESLTALEKVDLSYNPSLTDFSPLQNISTLRHLFLNGNFGFDLADLSSLPSLLSLGLGDNGLTDISALAGLTSLTSLELHNNPISDLTPLQGMVNLTYLDLNFVPLTDLTQTGGSATGPASVLSGLTKLTDLRLAGTGIRDLSFLSGLTELGFVELGDNPIQNIDGLRGLGKLHTVNLRGTAVDLSAGSSAAQVISELRGRGVFVDIDATGVNTPPELPPIPDQTVASGSATPFIPLGIFDFESHEGFILQASSSNPALVPNENILFGGFGTDRSLSVFPASGAAGVATITVTVFDPGGLSASQSFNVTIIRSISLPAPLYIEDFETTDPGTLPSGWTVQNATDTDVDEANLGNPRSNSFKDWVVLSRNRVVSIGNAGFWDAGRRLEVAPGQVVNNQEVTSLVNGRFVYAESRTRVGNQVQYLFSPDFDLTEHSGVRISFNSIYEQSPDSIGAVEYSVDGGSTWLPIIYMIDRDDVVRTSTGAIDAMETLSASRPAAPGGASLGSFIGVAPADWASLGTYISPRAGDDPIGSKRVEVFKIPLADHQSQVRFRFAHASASGSYFGIDEFAIYAGTAGGPAGGTFNSDFNFDPTGLQINFRGSAKWKSFGGFNGGGFISLTDAEFGQEGWIVLPDLNDGQPISGFVATFKLRMGGGTFPPADGFSFNYASLNDPVITSGSGWVDGVMEEGTPTGVAINFDTWDNGAEAPAIDVRVDGALRENDRVWFSGPGSGGQDVLLDTDGVTPVSLGTGNGFTDVRIEYGNGALLVEYKGLNIYQDLPLPSVLPPGRFILGARTGGASDNHWIDDLNIQVTSGEFGNTPPTVSSIPNFSAVAGQISQAVSFLVNDAETQPANLVVTAFSLNPAIIPNTSIALLGTGSGRELKVQPLAGTSGQAVITLQVSDGELISSSAFEVKVQAIAQVGNIVNGSFENGDFSGWIVQDLAFPFSPLQVRRNGDFFGAFVLPVTPAEGQFAATTGFDGDGPGNIRLSQELKINSQAPRLQFAFRAFWDLTGASDDRVFSVIIEPEGGGTPLLTTEILRATAGTQRQDTGPSVAEVDLTQFAVSSNRVRISFNWNVPGVFTGPAEFQLDNVRLVGSTTGTPTSPLVTIPDAKLRQAVREQLGKPSGDLTESDLLKLKQLIVVGKDIADLTGLEKATNLETLDLGFNSQVTDFSALGQLTKLRFLGLADLNLSLVPDLSALTLLNTLILSGNPIDSLSPLASIQNSLFRLAISRTDITSYSELANFSNLQSLAVEGNNITSLSELATLTQLRELAAGKNPLADIALIDQFTNLEVLNLYGLPATITDFSPLGQLSNLSVLVLNDNGIADVSFLSSLANLSELNLFGNNIGVISVLPNLPNLSRLFLGGNPISDYSPLANLRNLKTLSIIGGTLRDLSIVSGMSNLKELNLFNNDVTDIRPLLNLPTLGFANVQQNKLDITAGSATRDTIASLQSRGISVQFDPQKQFTGTPPAISRIPDQTTGVDTATGEIAFTVADAETDAAALDVTLVSSSNPALVPVGNVTLGGSGSNRTVDVNPASGQSGAAKITLRVTDANGLARDATFLVTVLSGDELQFILGTASGARFTEVVVPVTVKKFTQVGTFQYSIHWDPTVATLGQLEQFNLTGLTSGKFGVSQVSSGTLTVAWNDPNNAGVTLNDDTAIYAIRFKLIGPSGAVSPLRIDGIPTAVEATDSQFTTVITVPVSGQLKIQTGATLSGKVTYYGGNKLVPGVTVALSGGKSENATTGAAGTFSFAAAAGADYAIEPSRGADAGAPKGVTALDIALIRQHVLAVKGLDSPFTLLAADVNGSSSVSSADIGLIRRLILGLADTLPAGSWKFLPSNHSFSDKKAPWNPPGKREFTGLNADALGQDFVGIRLGDVNASWAPPASGNIGVASVSMSGNSSIALLSVSSRTATQSQESGHAVRFQIGNGGPGTETLTGAAGSGESGSGTVRKSDLPNSSSTVAVPILVSDFEKVTSAQFTVEWNPDELQYAGVDGFGVRGLADGNFGERFIEDGRLTFSWDDPQGVGATVEDGASLFSIGFRALQPGSNVPAVRFSDEPTVREVTVDGVVVEMITVDGFAGEAGEIASSALRIRGLDWSGTLGAGGVFRLEIPTVSGRQYVLESTETLGADSWLDVDAVFGDGESKVLSDPSTTGARRFYRVREE